MKHVMEPLNRQKVPRDAVRIAHLNFIDLLTDVYNIILINVYLFFKDFIYFILERGEGKKKRERNINVWLPTRCPILGTWPSTQTCALTGNQTREPLVCRPALNPLSYTSQG